MDNIMTHLTIKQINNILELLEEYKLVTLGAIEEAKRLGMKKEAEFAKNDIDKINAAIESLENIKV